MNCNCNKPKRCCGAIPVRTCCSGSNAVSKSDFYDYKNNMETDLYDINRDLASKELKLNELEIEDTKLDSSKQNRLVAGNNIILTENADKTTTITAVGSAGAYYAGDGINIDTTNNEISVNDTIQRTLTAGSGIDLTSNNISVDNTIQRTLIAGQNITIDPVTNTISAADGGETYTAGPGIVISSTNEISTIMQQSNYYDKTEVDQLIADLDNISMEVVSALPSTGLSNVIYLVERAGTTIYDQWVYSGGQWHNVGDTNIDLNDYYTKTEADALLDDKQDKLTYNSEITTLADTQQVSQVDLTAKKVNFFSLSTLWTWIKNKINGGASTIVDTNLTTSRALVSNTSGKVAVSNVTNTELGYLSGVTSAIQTQINDMWKKIYPVGSIYITMSLDNPGTLFGGTWQKIEDRFLLATGSTYNVVNSMGGASTVTLTRANLPKVSITTSSNGKKQFDLSGVKGFQYKSGGEPNKWGLDYGTKELYEKKSYTSTEETASDHTHTFNLNGNVTQTSVNKMPPYITVNVWKRTA